MQSPVACLQGGLRELPERMPSGNYAGSEELHAECDSSHAVAGPAEESLRAGLTQWTGGGMGCLEANGSNAFIKASSVCEQATMCQECSGGFQAPNMAATEGSLQSG